MSQTRAPRSATLPLPRPNTRRRGLVALGGVLVLAAGAVSACSSGNGSLEKSTLNVGYVEGIGASAVSLGVSKNDFSSVGLTVNLKPFPSDPAEETALKSGAIDIALGDYTEFLDTSASPVANSVQVIGEGYDAGDNTIGLVAASGSPLADQALTGDKTGVSYNIAQGYTSVAVPTSDSPEFVALANWLIDEQNPLGLGLDSIKSVQSQSTTGSDAAQAMVDQVVSGSANTAVLQEPFLTEELESGKVTEIADLDTGNANDMPIDGYFALANTVTSDPNTIAAFQDGLANSQALGESRVQIESALAQSGVTRQVAATTEIGNFPAGIVAANVSNILTLMGSAQIETSNLSSSALTGGTAANLSPNGA
jgi:NitT/TauT family transport system substrate-binding protein